MEKISQSELLDKLEDPHVSTDEISQYFRPAQGKLRPYSPLFEIDPSRVDMTNPDEPELYYEGLKEQFLDRLNRKYRKERQGEFDRRTKQGWTGLKFVAEGDSWFQFPLRGNNDLIDFLDDKYAIYCTSAAGDEFENMLAGRASIAADIRATSAHGLLFSGGGNDIAGDTFINYLRGYDPGFEPHQYISYKFDKFVNKAVGNYKSFFNELLEEFPDLKIFFHGYDRSFPRPDGDWLGPSLNEKEVPQEYWHAVISIMIDRYNVALKKLEKHAKGNIYFVDCRSAVGAYEEWRDELHALESGCRRAAQRFELAIDTAYSEKPITIADGSHGEGTRSADADLEGANMPASDIQDSELENAGGDEGIVEAVTTENLEEFLQGGDIIPNHDINTEDTRADDIGVADEEGLEGLEFEDTQARREARWPSYDENSTEYAHLSTLPPDRDFDFTPDDIELLVDLNHFELTGDNGKIVFGLRGATLKHGHQVEEVDTLELRDVRPDHIHLRCVMGFYDFNEKQFSAYTASTVPNAVNMHAYYRKVKNLPGSKRFANMLPSGAYAFRAAPHGYNKRRKKWKVPRALRMTNPETGQDAETVVLRSRNDLIYGTADYWDKSTPYDNIHPAFSKTSFSSAGCLTIRGSNDRYTNRGYDQWKKFLAHLLQMDANSHIDLMLLTGADAAIAAKIRAEGNIGNPDLVSNELERLRIGSTGDAVKKLQEFLQIESTRKFDPDTKIALIEMQKTVVPLNKADGIYSPEMDRLFGTNILTEPEASPEPLSVASITTPSGQFETTEEAHAHAHDEEDMYPELEFEVQTDPTWGEDPTLEASGPKLWYPEAERILPMRVKGRYRRGYPEGAVIHSTEGRSKKGDKDAINTINFGIGKRHCYFCISSTGRIYQPAPLNRWGIHAGRCAVTGLGKNIDNKLMGIEICCAGMTTPAEDGFETWWGDVYPPNEVRETEKVENITRAGFYHKFNDLQERALMDLLLWLHTENPKIFKLENIFGHDEIAVNRAGQHGRKQDPGGSLSSTMPAFRNKLQAEMLKRMAIA